ncbi:hypothetical protein Mesil_1225 [Allomeiothermus silvanus DSM 9946]|uniref:Uncharacterized protein n=1 Tax=Allomeiothermus silvanus (strain ATCC 700542 / DSM 9946 / NBRC 106475 / NCIMB 13440 / VI-R2) TaxID=526227 RepID=D7BDX1_ALLS1|nr:hypothetical protein [Allomeiothermus silvanus]ADH63122.1 hypothetical protein Mesil_1225 [Allomeiothermus silvanus DSM 9946]
MGNWQIGLVVLASVVIAFVLLWDSLSKSRDIPQGWLWLIALVWGSVLGVSDLIRRFSEQKKNKGKEDNSDD